MPGASALRDSTEIVLPAGELGAGIREQLERRFTVTIFDGAADDVRVIGSPVEIKRASGFLSRRGVPLR
ncbi:MAG: hypothetical protein ABEJ42_05105 [Halobacteriaceae archaeon]